MAKKIKVIKCFVCPYCKPQNDRFNDLVWYYCSKLGKEVDPEGIDKDCEFEDY